MTARETIALTLNKLRKENGYSVDEVGKLVDKSPKTISAWEVGRGQPDADMLVRLCEVYGVNSVGVFFNEPTAAAGEISNTELDLLSNFRMLDENGREKVMEYTRDQAKILQKII